MKEKMSERASAKLIHEILPVGWLQCNCHIVGDPETREALVLDPGDDAERVLGLVNRHGLKVKTIVSTHAHIDHVGGLKKLRDATGAPVVMHGDDLELYNALETQAAWIGMKPPERAEVEGLLRDGDVLRWGRLAAHVMHTPGHTPGSICLHLPAATLPAQEISAHDILFAGDTLFAGSIGRTDLWGGSFEQIMRSLQARLLALPDDTLVYPGHGPMTDIGQERETNPFLQHPMRR
jgi:glyoxylase-like metal-dependent hydrolase (beta-lactamase superfamily II)